jgi:tRNA(adenine34) deaminase
MDIKEDERFMRLALQEAEEALALDEVPVGAVIVSKGAVIARGHNLCEQLDDFTAHAEMQAFTSASEYLGGKFLDTCTLYVTLEPCPMCAGAAFWTRVGRIVYGAPDLKRGYQRWQVPTEKMGHGGAASENGLLHPKTEILGGVLSEECSQLVKGFFAAKRKKED